MVYKRWEKKFSIEEMIRDLKTIEATYEITRQSAAFGGWSLLSSNGDYRDGWHQGHKRYQSSLDMRLVEDELKNSKSQDAYIYPTEICKGVFMQMVTDIKQSGFTPQRARIIKLNAQSSTSWHQDAANSDFMIRLHIPLITNENCFFETESKRVHMPADGHGYFIQVNELHRAVNHGKADRYHIVMDIKESSALMSQDARKLS